MLIVTWCLLPEPLGRGVDEEDLRFRSLFRILSGSELESSLRCFFLRPPPCPLSPFSRRFLSTLNRSSSSGNGDFGGRVVQTLWLLAGFEPEPFCRFCLTRLARTRLSSHASGRCWSAFDKRLYACHVKQYSFKYLC